MPIHSSLFTVEVTFLVKPWILMSLGTSQAWGENQIQPPAEMQKISFSPCLHSHHPQAQALFFFFLFQCFILFAYFCFLLSSLFFWHFHLTITTILGVKGCPLCITSEGLTVNAFTFTPTQNKKFRGHGLFSQLPPQLLSRVSFLVPNAGIVTQELYVQKTRKQSPRQPATEMEERC